ncbi:hypothetical protein BDN72DRAFT_833826 [Pluteus cervinus]|uniref:Uncharacterized protein n=1 Tax=Pluteus cervinus TaxID=181527 RepID=A0ACD3B968_9AGAR|nr:hypothetical protein BDN72DRAFT_833826 [Pluteus cervinus]
MHGLALPPPYTSTSISADSRLSDTSNSYDAFLQEPPSYKNFSSHRLITDWSGRSTKEFTYALKSGNRRPWASLILCADASRSSSIPTYTEGECITGSVVLNTQEGDPVQAIDIIVQGQVITGTRAQDTYTFLNHPVTIWNKSMGDMRSSSREDFTNDESCWDFCIGLPSQVEVTNSRNSSRVFRLPSAFLEHCAQACIQYTLVVNFTRSRLRTNKQLAAIFGYIQITRPSPGPYIPGQITNQGDSELRPPDVDSHRWQTLSPIFIRGMGVGEQSIMLKCTLSLAKPLCYTRGTVIPCAMTIEAVDSGSTPEYCLANSRQAIALMLRRTIEYSSRSNYLFDKSESRTVVDHIETAVWGPTTTSQTTDGQSQHQYLGEIPLKNKLAPSSAIGHLSIKYLVSIFAFEDAALKSNTAITKPLLEYPVVIATSFGKGPRRRSFIPQDGSTPLPQLIYMPGAG